MKNLFSILIFCSMFSFEDLTAQSTCGETIFGKYSQLYKNDQFANHYNDEEFRHLGFEVNFKKLNLLLEEHQKCTTKFKNKEINKISSYQRSVLTHTLQSNPELVLNDTYIMFIQHKIENAIIDRECLAFAMSIFAYLPEQKNVSDAFKDRIILLKPFYMKAIEIWGIQSLMKYQMKE